MELEVANKEKELERRTNRMNMDFFANISHEFRNPLTVISGPLVSLYQDPALSEESRRRVHAVIDSSNTMLRLIDQTLDFNQLEMDELRLRVSEHDIAWELSRLADTFEESFRLRNVTLEREGLKEPLVVPLDADKLEKITYNLFTNAMKHVKDGGVVRLALDTMGEEDARDLFPDRNLPGGNYCRVSLTNDGNPIAPDKMDTVFKRYYQVAGSYETHDWGWGRGIGLYYVSRMVELHHGAIRVDNTDEGVCFSFVLPASLSAYSAAEKTENEVRRIQQIAVTPAPVFPGTGPSADGEENKPRMLVVDDDVQVARYLRLIFEADFAVSNRYSAESAFRDLEEIAPDIIISDVVMDHMSGYEFCRKVKSSEDHAHIPFILLTAKSEVEDSVSGLQCGANAYVTKPFREEYLKALVQSQMASVQAVRSYLNQHTEAPEGGESALSPRDRQLMQDLYALMENHLKDADLNIDAICEALRVSRSKFGYKLKALTGSTPGAFFRQYKMNKAAELLREGKYTVSEVADLTGFSAVSNFSAAFKKQFGVSPSDFK